MVGLHYSEVTKSIALPVSFSEQMSHPHEITWHKRSYFIGLEALQSCHNVSALLLLDRLVKRRTYAVVSVKAAWSK